MEVRARYIQEPGCHFRKSISTYSWSESCPGTGPTNTTPGRLPSCIGELVVLPLMLRYADADVIWVWPHTLLPSNQVWDVEQVSAEDLGLMDNCGYMTLDAFTGKDLGKVSGTQPVSYMVNPSGEKFRMMNPWKMSQYQKISLTRCFQEFVWSGTRLTTVTCDQCRKLITMIWNKSSYLWNKTNRNERQWNDVIFSPGRNAFASFVN